VIAVTKALTDLPNQVHNVDERDFLTEALNCYRVRAYRATIVMAWNLAYDHFIGWIFKEPARIQSLNAGIVSKFPKRTLVVAKREDVDELKESELIEAARIGHLLDKNTTQILKEKLNRRNMAAHPSGVAISQHQADDM
jgi:hypothetical protein